MDEPIGKQKYIPKGKICRKVSEVKHLRSVSHKVVRKDITKEQFLANLNKVCQPINKEPDIKSDSEKTEK